MKSSITFLAGRKRWRLEYRRPGKRVRAVFQTKALAEAELDRVKADVERSGGIWVSMTHAERNELMAVVAEIKATSLTPRDVWEKYKAGINSTSPKTVTAKFVRDEFIAAKEKIPRDDLYIASLWQIINAFIEGRETWPMDRFTAADVEAFEDARPNNKSTIRKRLSTWFRFCVRRPRQWIGHNPCDDLEPLALNYKKPMIFVIKEVKASLEWFKQNPRAAVWFILSTFEGLRPEEAMQTDLDKDISLNEGWIKIEHQTAKVRQRRVFQARPETLKLLKYFKKKGAQLPLTIRELRAERDPLKAELKFQTWPQDITRHTAATYMLANTAADKITPEQIAYRLGTSLAKLHRNYKAVSTPDGQVITAKMAVQFWKLIA